MWHGTRPCSTGWKVCCPSTAPSARCARPPAARCRASRPRTPIAARTATRSLPATATASSSVWCSASAALTWATIPRWPATPAASSASRKSTSRSRPGAPAAASMKCSIGSPGPTGRGAKTDSATAAGSPSRSVDEVLDRLARAGVPAGRVYTAKDIAEDPHYRAREMILQQTTRAGYPLDVPGIVPKLLGTRGSVRSAAPGLGDDTDAVLGEIGLTARDIAALRDKKVVA